MFHIIHFMSLISFCCALSIDNTNKPIMLFNELYSDKEWELLDSDNNLSVYTKNINNKNLKAVMVKQELALPKDVLQDVIMDIGNYKKFLRNSESFVSIEIKKTDTFIDGYQFIPVDVPFFDNREYLISKPIYIPDNYNLIIKAGANLKFSKNSYIFGNNVSLNFLGEKTWRNIKYGLFGVLTE